MWFAVPVRCLELGLCEFPAGIGFSGHNLEEGGISSQRQRVLRACKYILMRFCRRTSAAAVTGMAPETGCAAPPPRRVFQIGPGTKEERRKSEGQEAPRVRGEDRGGRGRRCWAPGPGPIPAHQSGWAVWGHTAYTGAIECQAGAMGWVLDSSFPSFPSVLCLRPGIRARELFTEGNEGNEDLACWGEMDGFDVRRSSHFWRETPCKTGPRNARGVRR